MAYSITLSEEEIVLLEDLLHHELGNIASEHRRTRNPEFRHEIEHRKELEQRLLSIVEHARGRGASEAAGRFPA